jgi:hypothetical protein
VFEKTDGSANDPDGGIAFTNTGIDGVVETALNIRGDGNVGVGTTAPAYKLDVEGDIECTALHETSDSRLKSDIQPITDALFKIEQLKGVSFRWNNEAESIGASAGDKQIGVLAREVESVFPELVSIPENGYKSVDYTKLTAVLIEAVKELNAQNKILLQRIEALETSP